MSVRRVKKSELNDLVNLVSTIFQYPESVQISRDLPLLFADQNVSHLWTYEDKQKMVSHAGNLFRPIYIENKLIESGAIGGVATLETSRGKGFAKSLVEKCCDDLSDQGAALAFLWTGEHDFYRRLGFELVGRQWSIQIPYSMYEKIDSEANLLSSNTIEIKTGHLSVLEQGRALLDRHPLRVEREQKDFELLLSSQGENILSAHDGSKLLAYIIVGKGMDLKDHIHEWAGEESALLRLIAFALKKWKRDLTLLSPQFTPEEASMIYTLESIGMNSYAGYMSMVKILNFVKLEDLIRDISHRVLFQAQMDSANLKLQNKGADGKYMIAWNDCSLQLSESEFLSFIFGPEAPSEQMKLSDEAKLVFDAIFPLRIWWWGMDSV